MKARPPSVPRSQGRALPSVLGTTLPRKEPETRNKGVSNHVAKAVCHGNTGELLAGRLLQLLRAWFLTSPRSPSAKWTVFCQAITGKNTTAELSGSIHQPSRARPAEFPDSGYQTVESLLHRASRQQQRVLAYR